MSAAATESVQPVRSRAIRTIAYRSAKRLEVRTMSRSVGRFRVRNEERGITGMLVEHGPALAHLMEGTPEAVERLWRAVLRDPRHTDVEMIADVPSDARLFGEHPLGFVASEGGSHSRRASRRRAASDAAAARASTENGLDSLPFEALFGAPEQAMAGWAQVAASTRPREMGWVRTLLTEAVRGVPDDLLRHARLLQAEGCSVEALFLNLIEPAARALGDRWQADQLSQVDVTVAMGALQLLVRQLGQDFQRQGRPFQRQGRPFQRQGRPGLERRTALVALMPEESHLVEVGLVSEFLERAGWDVACAYPVSGDALSLELRAHRYDLLAVCSSGAFERPERHASIERLVGEARCDSINSSLAILLTGRDFRAHPRLGTALGADGSLSSAGEAAGAAEAVLRRREGLTGSLRENLRRVLPDVLLRR